MTNEFVKQCLREYQNTIQNRVLTETNYDGLINLLKRDIQKLRAKTNQNSYTQISLQDYEKYLKEKNVDFRYIANLTMKVFFDYYITNITEPIQDQVFDLMTEFFNFFLNRAMIYNQLTVLNLTPVKIKNWQNHSNDYYHLLYQNLLANDGIYKISENPQAEIFRQYCNGLCRVLILNNKFDYLIDFYNKANRIIEPKVLIEYFVELKDKINNKKYNYNLCKFISQLFEKLDFTIYEDYFNIDLQQNIEEQIDKNIEKNTKTGLNVVFVFGKILTEICEFFKEFEQDKILFNGFDKYTDAMYISKMQTAKTQDEVDEIVYKCQTLNLYSGWLQCYKQDAGIMIAISTIKSVDEDGVEYIAKGKKISENCLDYIEQIIDYLIYLKQNNVPTYTTQELDNKIYKLTNLYIRARSINQKIISYDDEGQKIYEYKQQIEAKLNKLQDVIFTVNKYLATQVTPQRKEQIVKDYLKSAFDSYKINGRITNCVQEYGITNLQPNNINKYYNAIKNNTALVDQIVTGEILAEPYVKAKDENYDFGSGDYTNLVVCQIKGVERYLKEVLVQYHKDNIWKTKQPDYERQPNRPRRDQYNWKEIDRVRNGQIILNQQNPTAEDLHNLECGSAAYALLMAYKLEDKRQEFTVSSKFMEKFVYEVRNGHLHIDTIKTIPEVIMRRTQTAFWLMHLIEQLGNKGILNR